MQTEDVSDAPAQPPAQRLQETVSSVGQQTERAIADRLMRTSAAASKELDSFSTWLTAGSGAIAAYWISSAESLIDLLTPLGFKLCGLLLLASLGSGFLARRFHMRCIVSEEAASAGWKVMEESMQEHGARLQQFRALADEFGVTVQDTVHVANAYKIVMQHVPWYLRSVPLWKKTPPSRPYLFTMRAYLHQDAYSNIQMFIFELFIACGLVFAATDF